jgi:hypothetical protein
MTVARDRLDPLHPTDVYGVSCNILRYRVLCTVLLTASLYPNMSADFQDNANRPWPVTLDPEELRLILLLLLNQNRFIPNPEPLK